MQIFEQKLILTFRKKPLFPLMEVLHISRKWIFEDSPPYRLKVIVCSLVPKDIFLFHRIFCCARKHLLHQFSPPISLIAAILALFELEFLLQFPIFVLFEHKVEVGFSYDYLGHDLKNTKNTWYTQKQKSPSHFTIELDNTNVKHFLLFLVSYRVCLQEGAYMVSTPLFCWRVRILKNN